MKTKTLDSKKSLIIHKKIIKTNKFLNKIYESYYQEIKKDCSISPIVEIGSGGGFIKKIISKAITTDVIKADGIDIVTTAENLPFNDGSVGSFVMLNVFHHIKDPVKAIKEFSRSLKKGGKIIMIEPYNSFWGKFIYSNFHHETFDPSTSNWKIKGKGRMSDANGAIPWIIFVRDQKLFKNKFPNLKITKIQPHTPFKYLLSGGLSKPQLVPTSLFSIVTFTEKILSPLNKYLGMFVTIELIKI